MCGSCKEFEPTWESLSEELKLSSKVKVGRCSIDDKLGMKLAQEQGILNQGWWVGGKYANVGTARLPYIPYYM